MPNIFRAARSNLHLQWKEGHFARNSKKSAIQIQIREDLHAGANYHKFLSTDLGYVSGGCCTCVLVALYTAMFTVTSIVALWKLWLLVTCRSCEDQKKRAASLRCRWQDCVDPKTSTFLFWNSNTCTSLLCTNGKECILYDFGKPPKQMTAGTSLLCNIRGGISGCSLILARA